MKLKVVDQLSVSSVGPGTMGKDTEFEVTDAIGEDLVKRGLAYPADQSRPEKGKPGAPLNKEAEPASNKIIGAGLRKTETKPVSKA